MAELDTSGSAIWNAERIIFEQGKSYLVEAPSGKGKTTLLSTLYGIRRDYRGTVALDGQDIRELKINDWPRIRQKRISYIFQGLELFDDLTARENILLKNSLTRQLPEKEIESMAEMTGIAPFLDRKAGLLSFGQKQRVAIIRALCQPFEFLLADECFSHIDQANSLNAFELLTTVCSRQGAGLIFTSLNHPGNFHFDHHYLL